MANAPLFFRVLGEGQPFILLHGALGNSDQWLPIAKQLSKHYQVIIPDLPNHGRSFHTPDFELKFTAKVLAEWIKEHYWQNSILLGHSWGAKVAMQLANDFPELVEKLILVGAVPKYYELNETHRQWIDAIHLLQNNQFRSFTELSGVLKEIFPTGSDQALFLKNFKLHQGRLVWKANALPIAENFNYFLQAPEIIQKIPIPALFLKGEDSKYILPEDEILIASTFSNYQIEEIKTTRHSPHLENPELFLEKVWTFLN